MRTLQTPEARREHYRTNVPYVFGVTAELYYATWGDFFHLAVFEPDDDPADFDRALARTHERYFEAVDGARARHIIELGCGGGAFAAWMAARTRGQVLGIDLSDAQLLHTPNRVGNHPRQNLGFLKCDIMNLGALSEGPFDAAICLDAACYLPDKRKALQVVATKLSPRARLLLVDWCRAEQTTALQRELILEPFYRAWGIPEMETVRGYEAAFQAAGFRLHAVEDLSHPVAPNWQRAYDAAIHALGTSLSAAQISSITRVAINYGTGALRLAKDQFQAALLIKAAADSGLLRYVSFLAERE